MYCKNCGNKMEDKTAFCNNCGTKQDQASDATQPPPPQDQQNGGYQQEGSYRQPPPSGAYTPSPQPYTNANMPQKNNTTKIVLIALAGLVVILGVVLTISLLKPTTGNNNVSAAQQSSPQVVQTVPNATDNDNNDGVFDLSDGDTNNTPAVPDYDYTNIDNGLVVFDTPVWSTQPIDQVLSNGVWTSVGIATNPRQMDGEYGIMDIDDFEDDMFYVEFFADETFSMKFVRGTSAHVQTDYYEIMDNEYVDTYLLDDEYGYRFYYGDDGRLYMCAYEDIEYDGTYPDTTDFLVFELRGDTVDWDAEDVIDYTTPDNTDYTNTNNVFIVFDTPVLSTEPVYQVLSNGVWTSVGVATNPYQLYGEDGTTFDVDAFDDFMVYVEFFADETYSMKSVDGTTVDMETDYYEIMDIEYVDGYTDEWDTGWRFYYGDDGRLYVCLYEDMWDDTYPDVSDFIVFELRGDTVDWNAEG